MGVTGAGNPSVQVGGVTLATLGWAFVTSGGRDGRPVAMCDGAIANAALNNGETRSPSCVNFFMQTIVIRGPRLAGSPHPPPGTGAGGQGEPPAM